MLEYVIMSYDPDRFYFRNIDRRPASEILVELKNLLTRNGYKITSEVKGSYLDVYECAKDNTHFRLCYSPDDCDNDVFLYADTEAAQKAIKAIIPRSSASYDAEEENNG